MKKLLTLLLVSTAFTVLADENTGNGSGLYVGVGAGAGWDNQASPATTFRIDGGYNFNQNWAIELGTTGLTQSGAAFNQNMQYYDLSVKGTLPLGSMLDLYAQVGGAYSAPGTPSGNYDPNSLNVNSTALQSSWGFMSGVGVDVNFTKNIAINLSDLYYYGQSTGVQGNTNVVLLGFKYSM